MGGKGRYKSGSNPTPRSQPHISMTLREQSSGKKNANVSSKTMCKVDHLKSIALWAAVEASLPPLGAFFGERLAATTEALGLRSDPTSFVCERCESILQPGSNCTVRIERNKSNKRWHKRKKSNNPTTQNNVVYRCHFCSNRNLVRGTPKDYLKQICPSKAKPSVVKLETTNADAIHLSSCPEIPLETSCPEIPLETSCPKTPLPAIGLSLLDSKRRKRNNRSGVKKVTMVESGPSEDDEEKKNKGSSKRSRKSWTSLKEIAESGNDKKKFTDITVPFFL